MVTDPSSESIVVVLDADPFVSRTREGTGPLIIDVDLRVRPVDLLSHDHGAIVAMDLGPLNELNVRLQAHSDHLLMRSWHQKPSAFLCDSDSVDRCSLNAS